MSLVEERYRFLIDSVHRGDLAKFKEELRKTGICSDLLQLQHCRYAKSQDNIIILICKLGRVDFLQVLVDNLPSANDPSVLEYLFNLSNADGKTPLHEAAQFSQPQIVELLLANINAAKIDPIKRADWTPLMLACTKTGTNAQATVQILLDHGANLLLENKDGWTPFHLAAREGDLQILRILLDKNHQAFKSKSKNGRSPLHTACLSGHIDAAKLIIGLDEKHAFDQRDTCGTTPIMEAVRGGHTSLVKYLASFNPQSLCYVDILERNCLHLAAESGHQDLVRLLVNDLQMDVNGGPITPLHWAAKEGHTDTIQTLLELCADPHRTDEGRRVPLALAIGGQHVNATLVLLKNTDSTTPFDLKLLALAKTSEMKRNLEVLFKTQWNLLLYLPGTD